MVATAERLRGRKIRIVVDQNPHIRSMTGWYASTPEVAFLFVRKRDETEHRMFSGLHELAHVLVSAAPAGLLPSPLRNTDRPTGKVMRLCFANDPDASPAEAKVERFVERVALHIEGVLADRLSRVEAHL